METIYREEDNRQDSSTRATWIMWAIGLLVNASLAVYLR